MSVLSDFNLVLPQVPSEDEWIEYIESTEGRERDISTLRAKGYNLLADLNERHATYERVGWLSLWAKAYRATCPLASSVHLLNNFERGGPAHRPEAARLRLQASLG